ncbi:MAG TPA: GAF domain-containing protein [Chryseosolibacter sp.]
MMNISTISKIRSYFPVVCLSIGIVFLLILVLHRQPSHRCYLSHGLEAVRMNDGATITLFASALPFSLDWITYITDYEMWLSISVFLCATVFAAAPLSRALRSIGKRETIRHERQKRDLLKSVIHKSKKNVGTQHNLEEVLRGMLENNFDVAVAGLDDTIASLLASVQQRFRSVVEKETLNEAVHSNVTEIERLLKDESDQSKLNDALIRQISKSVNAGVGVLYKWNDTPDDQYFYEVACFGFYDNRHTKKKVNNGEGQLGEMSSHKRPVLLTNVPKGYLVIQSGLGSATATDVAIFPLLFKGELYGAIEIALFQPLTGTQVTWLERVSESIGAHFFNYKVNADGKAKLEALTKKQADELVEIHRLQESTLRTLESKLVEVENEKTKSAQILEGCVDGVITFDHHGTVQFCNRAAQDILGHNKNYILSTAIQELLPVIIREELGVWKPFYAISSGEREISIRTEATLGTSDGGTVDTLLTCTRVEHAGANLFTFFIQKISVDLF